MWFCIGQPSFLVLPCSRDAPHPIRVLASMPVLDGGQSPIVRNTDEGQWSLAHVPEIRFQSPCELLLRLQDTVSSIRLRPLSAPRVCRPSLPGGETKRVESLPLHIALEFHHCRSHRLECNQASIA